MGGWVVRQSPHIRITLVAWALKPRKHWTVGVFERITLPNLINMVRVYIVWNAWPCKTLQMNCLRNVLCTWFRIRIIKNMFSKKSICLIDLPQSFVVLIQMWPARHEFNRKDSMNTCQCFNALIRSHVSAPICKQEPGEDQSILAPSGLIWPSNFLCFGWAGGNGQIELPLVKGLIPTPY